GTLAAPRHEQAPVGAGRHTRRGRPVAPSVYRHDVTRFAVLLGLLVACSSHDKPKPQQEPERPKRVIEPPSRGVRALPPHAIRADGVGPYKLGATETELLDQSPRMSQLTIPGFVRRDLLRAEDDAI